MTKSEQARWLGEKIDEWRHSVATLTGVLRQHPQTVYTGLQKSLQQEWSFVQCVAPGVGMVFQAVEDDLLDTFLQALFQGDTSHIPGRTITGLPNKKSGIAFPDPPHTVGANWTASYVITGHLVSALCRTDKFSSEDYALVIEEGR